MVGILTAEATAQLQEGIDMLLSRWAALRMAVENEWGGRDSLQKSQQLGHDLFHRLTQSKGDGSIEEIAENMMVMREECLEGNFNSIKELKETNTPSISYARQASTNGEDDSDEGEGEGDGEGNSGEDISSDMEVDTPLNESNVNQKNTTTNGSYLKDVPEVVDGWTTVTSRRNKGRRN